MKRSQTIAITAVAVAALAMASASPASAVTKSGTQSCSSPLFASVAAKGASSTTLWLRVNGGPGIGYYTWTQTQRLPQSGGGWSYVTTYSWAQWSVTSSSTLTNNSYGYCVGY